MTESSQLGRPNRFTVTSWVGYISTVVSMVHHDNTGSVGGVASMVLWHTPRPLCSKRKQEWLPAHRLFHETRTLEDKV